jgi:hypothetical protein
VLLPTSSLRTRVRQSAVSQCKGWAPFRPVSDWHESRFGFGCVVGPVNSAVGLPRMLIGAIRAKRRLRLSRRELFFNNNCFIVGATCRLPIAGPLPNWPIVLEDEEKHNTVTGLWPKSQEVAMPWMSGICTKSFAAAKRCRTSSW